MSFPQLAQYDLTAPACGDTMPTLGDVMREGIDMLVTNTHAASYNRGWWHDPLTGKSLIPKGFDPSAPETEEWERLRSAVFPLVIAAKIALIHSEVSEALEAFRVDGVDNKIPFPGVTAEMADVVIRVGDLMGCLQMAAAEGIIIDGVVDGQRVTLPNAFSLSAAIMTKMPFNAGRPDHDLAKRMLPGQKKF